METTLSPWEALPAFFLWLIGAVIAVLWVLIPLILIHIHQRLKECVGQLETLNRNTRTFFLAAHTWTQQSASAGYPRTPSHNPLDHISE